MKKIFTNDEFFKTGIFIIGGVLVLMFLIFGGNSNQNESGYLFSVAKAGSSNNLFGYAWSDNIGWISFNCLDGGVGQTDICSTSDYGVGVDADNNLFGYAWSDNIGWISFNESDLYDCPKGTCKAKLIESTTLEGWAKALSANEEGWDGWISLSTQPSGVIDYGVILNEEEDVFTGYAWGGEVVGWISFNCLDGGVGQTDICSTSDYKVVFAGEFPKITNFVVSSVLTGDKPFATLETVDAVSCDLVSDTGYEDLDICHNVNQCATITNLPIDKEVMEETTYTLTCFNGIGDSVNFESIPREYFELTADPVEVMIDFAGGGATSTPTQIGVISYNGFTDLVSFSSDVAEALPESPGTETTNEAIFSRSSLSFVDYFTHEIKSTLKMFASQRFVGEEDVTVSGNDGVSTVNIRINAGKIEPVYEEI